MRPGSVRVRVGCGCWAGQAGCCCCFVVLEVELEHQPVVSLATVNRVHDSGRRGSRGSGVGGEGVWDSGGQGAVVVAEVRRSGGVV